MTTQKYGTKKRVKKKRVKKDFFILKCLILAFVSFSVILFYVWERVELLGAGYLIREKTEKERKLTEEKELLLSEAVRLKSPQRLEKIARGELGLVTPTEGKSIRRIAVKYKNN